MWTLMIILLTMELPVCTLVKRTSVEVMLVFILSKLSSILNDKNQVSMTTVTTTVVTTVKKTSTTTNEQLQHATTFTKPPSRVLTESDDEFYEMALATGAFSDNYGHLLNQ